MYIQRDSYIETQAEYRHRGHILCILKGNTLGGHNKYTGKGIDKEGIRYTNKEGNTYGI